MLHRLTLLAILSVLSTLAAGCATAPNAGLKPAGDAWYCLDYSADSPSIHASCGRTKDACEALRAKESQPTVYACIAHPKAYCYTFSQDGQGDYQCFEGQESCGNLRDTRKGLLEADAISGKKYEISGCGTW